MSAESPPDDYYLGLLDSLLRVRFHVRVDSGPRFHPQPSVRIDTRGEDYLVVLVGELLEELDVGFDIVAPEQGHEYFSLNRQADFEALYQFTKGRSTQAVRELGFVTGPYQEHIGHGKSLSVDEMYGLARTIKELHYGTTYSGRAPLTDPARFRDEYDVTDVQQEPIEIPTDGFREEYPVEYIGGIVDALAIFRPSIGPSGYGVGYTMTPQINMSRSGVHPAYTFSIQQFCEEHDLACTTGDDMQQLKTVINGAAAIDMFAPVVGPYLIAKHDELAYLHGELVPRYLDEEHHTKQGFYELVVDFEPLAMEDGVRQRSRKYTPEYFEEEWAGEITPIDREEDSVN